MDAQTARIRQLVAMAEQACKTARENGECSVWSRLAEYRTSREEQAIEAFVQRLTAELDGNVADVLLFGSKARGEARPDSDLDVFVLVDRSDYAFKQAILWLAAEISLDYDVLLSPRVAPPEAWRKMVEAATLFYRSVVSEGIPLLPRPSQL